MHKSLILRGNLIFHKTNLTRFYQTGSSEEHVAEEMELVLASYDKAAASRIIDSVPMTFQREFVRKFLFSVQTVLKRTDAELEQLTREPNENIF
jgi:hypothetical protein